MEAANVSEALPADVTLAPTNRPSLFDVVVNGQTACYISINLAGCSVHTDDARGRKPRTHHNPAAAARAILRALKG